MDFHISRRNFVRILSFAIALIMVLAGLVYLNYKSAMDYRGQLQSTYVRSLGELSSYLTNISTDLDKGQYIGTPGQFSIMSARIWKEAGSAKSALSTLPVSELHMDNTYRFLSQVGDYAMSLSKKINSGLTLTEEERKSAQSLQQYGNKLKEYIDQLQQKIQDGQIDVTAVKSSFYENAGDDAEGTKAKNAGLAGGFEDLEQTMTGYPTLIYDGPFSDHILTKRPELTRAQPSITREEGRRKAALAAGLVVSDLENGDDENSNMPSFTYQCDGIAVGVTKSGGFVTYMVNSREIGEERLSYSTLLKNASAYLEKLGIENMRATYYETSNGICTINYAAMQGEVTLYTDLIKVGVALDDGAIVFYDARGYINNHKERSLSEPMITVEQAQKSLSDQLAVRGTRLALIPTSGQNEVLTYEFKTTTPKDENILVYVNAQTGAEEQILILIETPSGVLTK